MSSVHPAASAAPLAGRLPAVRRITTEDLRWALDRGWEDFRAKRGDILVLALIYPVVGLLTFATVADMDAFALAFPLAAGLSLMGPAVASGFYEIARRRERGEDASWRHFFDPWHGRAALPLALLTLGLGALFVLWVAAAWGIYSALFGDQPGLGVSDFLQQVFTTPRGWALILLGNVAGAVFAAAALAASVVSFPMLVDRDTDAASALATSLRATMASPGVVLRWGATVGVLLAVAAIPLFVGLAVALPVLGYATWHLYTRAVEQA